MIDFSKEPVWYLSQKLGKNSIGKFLGEAQKLLTSGEANGDKVANHSARKTSINNLMNSNVNPVHVTQLSGHKSLESLRKYSKPSKEQQKTISKIIGNNVNNKEIANLPSTSVENYVPADIEKQMLQPWNPVDTVLPPVFGNPRFNSFNININTAAQSSTSFPSLSIEKVSGNNKRKRLI